jgi:type II secretory pathway pseudopilin PulG
MLMSYKTAHRRMAAAFTLVELLVVIGIIALLIAILLPALSKARESANQAKCMAQQRQILQGMMLHANDHQGYMPMAGLMWTPGNATDPASLNDSRRRKYEYWGAGGGTYQLTSTPAGVAKYLNQEMNFATLQTIEKSMQSGLCRMIFVCPSDKTGGRLGTTVNNGGAHWTSYAFNEAALGWADHGTGGLSGHDRLRGHSTRFPHPSILMLLADAAPRGPYFAADVPSSWMLFNEGQDGATMGDWYRGYINKPTRPDGTPTRAAADKALVDPFRHRNRIMVGCADGHVENLALSEELDKISISVDFGLVKP